MARKYKLTALRVLQAASDQFVYRREAFASRHDVAFSIVGVYRARNENNVQRLIAALDPGADADVCLWSLDNIPESLRKVTLGSGPGSKFALLDKLIPQIPDDTHLVVIDDDVEIVQGSLAETLKLLDKHRVALAQPTHSRESHCTFKPLYSVPFLAWRETNFVEIGPIFIISGNFREYCLPFGIDVGMGWGLEEFWHAEAKKRGFKLAAIDRLRMTHLVPVGLNYDKIAARRKGDAMLKGRGIEPKHEYPHTVKRYLSI